MPAPLDSALTLRCAFPDDERALARLAALDSSPPLLAPVLLAEVDDELCAALSLDDGSAIADPFRHTVAVLALLRIRAGQLAGERAGSSRTPGVRIRVAAFLAARTRARARMRPALPRA
jgi:hypothetical protein